jgi:isocitrate/isopropylmalate dehydrogenase
MAALHKGITYLPESLVKYRQHSANLLGAVGGKRRKQDKQNKREKKRKEILDIRTRIQAFYDVCPVALPKEKQVLLALVKSYQHFSLTSNTMRMILFFRHYKLLLAPKKRSTLRNYLFCLKTFGRIV